MTLITPYQEAALDYKQHISLTANAGSGKTFVLSKRFVEIALREDIPLNSIVAITFTDKAASELYNKITKEINSRLDTVTDESEYKKLLRIRRQLVSAKISTIHSFCSELLREFSPEAGLDANFSLIDQTIAGELIEKEIFDYITANLTGERESDIKYLIRIVGSFGKLTDEFKSALYKIKSIRTVKEHIYNKPDDEILEYFSDKFNRVFELVINPEVDSILNAIKEINSAVLDNKPDNSNAIEVDSLLNKFPDCNSVRDQIGLLSQLGSLVLTKDYKLRKQGYLNKLADEFTHYELLLRAFFPDLRNFEIPDNAEQATEQLASFGRMFIDCALEISGKYTAAKRKFGYLDYEDLLHYTELLVREEKVREALSMKYQFIMIDEYQDTDEIQYNIFLPILDKLNTGNLFVVGDEKQSIYMFRDAELRVFEKTKHLINEKTSAEGILELPHSFRLSPRIALFCNTLFNRLFENPMLEFNEVMNSELVSTRDDLDTGEIQFLLDDSGNKDGEAELVAKKIKQLNIERHISFNDIAVLVRKRKSFDELEKVFSAHSIPYKILGGRGFYQQQVVYDICSYLLFLTDTTNDAALIAILRSPFYMITDREIFKISRCRGESFYTRLVECAIGNDKLSRVVESLEEHYSNSRKFELAELIRNILKETGYWLIVAARMNSKQEIANINKVLELAKNYNRHSFKTVYDFVDFLRTAINRYEDEGQAQIPEEGDSVNLMTIHQSKGLEFKAVFIFNTHMSTQTDQVRSGSISIDKDFGVLAKLPENNDYFNDFTFTPILGIYNYVSQRKSAAENKRLLYVAITRAIDYLFICGSVKSSPARNSFLKMIQEGLGSPEFLENYHIEGRLKLMIQQETEFEFSSENIGFDVPVINSLEEPQLIQTDIQEENIYDFKIHTKSIAASTKDEIISATKFNIYIQCPLKYDLTYNLGYTDLFKRFSQSIINYTNPEEDDEGSAGADLKGRIIHSLLENEIAPEKLEDEIKKDLLSENFSRDQSTPKVNELVSVIRTQVLNYYNSDIYKQIHGYENFRNEYEVYLSMNDFYLYGIIDKLILTDNELIVIDYKTDTITENKVSEKYEYYRNQLLFYGYVLRKHLAVNLPVKQVLVFIDKPELSVTERINDEAFVDFEELLIQTIRNIRKNNYPKNFAHCSKCHFTINKKCVVK